MNGFNKYILLMFNVIVACDMPSRLLVNEQSEYCINAEQGTVYITGTTLANDKLKICFSGDFIVKPSQLKIQNLGDKTFISIFYKNQKVNQFEKSIPIHGQDSMVVVIKRELPLKYGKGNTLKILPSAFIMCNESNVINDTIRIRKQ